MSEMEAGREDKICTLNNKERFKNVDFLRFIFAIAILFYHFGSSPGSFGILLKENSPIFQNIYTLFRLDFICVDFFFIMAGFFLFKSIKVSQDTTYFIKNKIIRLVPVIWFSILICMICSIFINNFQFQINNNIPLIFLVDQIGFNKCTSCTPQAWFVCALFWVSLFYFYIHKIFDKKYFNLITWIITAISISFIINCNAPGFAGNFRNSLIVFNHGTMRGLAGIGLGYFILMLYEQKFLQKITNFGKIIISALETYLIIFIFYYLFFAGKIPGNCYFIYIINFSILLYLFLIKQGFISKILDNNISTILGSWSYSIYIMHILIRNIINCLITIPHKEIALEYPIFIFSTGILLSIIVGSLTYYFFEKPVGNYLKKKFLNNTSSNKADIKLTT